MHVFIMCMHVYLLHCIILSALTDSCLVSDQYLHQLSHFLMDCNYLQTDRY